MHDLQLFIGREMHVKKKENKIAWLYTTKATWLLDLESFFKLGCHYIVHLDSLGIIQTIST